MEYLIGASVAIIIGGIALFIFQNQKKANVFDSGFFEYLETLKRDLKSEVGEIKKNTDVRLEKIDQNLSSNLRFSQTSIEKQFQTSQNLILEITKELSGVSATNKQVLNFTEKLQSLDNILKSPKNRGVLGEYFLEALLSQVFTPEQYSLQYRIAEGKVVDAAIFLKDKLVPIDAKFSLENYNKMIIERDNGKKEELAAIFLRDVRNRVDETAKYIMPEANTLDFAMMFIPAEGIFQYLIENAATVASDLFTYAYRKRVILVSPSSLFAYLQTIIHGMKAMKMEESINEMLNKIERLSKHLEVFDQLMKKTGAQLSTLVNTYNNSYREFRKVDKDIYRISAGKNGGNIVAEEVDKPQIEE